MDNKNKTLDFFYNVMPSFISQRLHCISLGKVTKYDKKTHTADVSPLPLDDDGNKRPSLIDCPVPSSIWQTDEFIQKLCKHRYIGHGNYEDTKGYQPMKVGSVVIVGFFDTDMDGYAGKKDNFSMDTDRKHSLNDGVVLGVMKP